MYRRCTQQYSDIFFVKKARKGRYRACVDLSWRTDPEELMRYCRDTSTREKANCLLDCLRHELASYPGQSLGVIEAWARGDICLEDHP